MYSGSAQGVVERVINVRYYYYYYIIRLIPVVSVRLALREQWKWVEKVSQPSKTPRHLKEKIETLAGQWGREVPNDSTSISCSSLISVQPLVSRWFSR